MQPRTCNCSSPGSCGCCAGIRAQTPAIIHNRPGLDALAYRIGTHAQFKTTMVARLGAFPAIASLTTRQDDDLSIALLDAWATLADVLSFYSERIATEAYLRTATERLSLTELARLIGYEPRPGVSASCWLAFMLEDGPEAPPEVLIEARTPAQSVPRKGELPQIFETSDPVVGRADWNAMRPQLTRPQPVSLAMNEVVVKGADTQLKVGDPLLIVVGERPEERRLREISTVSIDRSSDTTRIVLQPLAEAAPARLSPVAPPAVRRVKESDLAAYAAINFYAADLALARSLLFSALAGESVTDDRLVSEQGIYAFRTRAALFGHNAPDWRTMPDNVRAHYVGSGGLFGQYFEDADWGPQKINIAEANAALYSARFFAPGTLLRSRTDPQINFMGAASFSLDGRETLFSAAWTGWLRPPRSGSYRFSAIADDGIRLIIGRSVVLSDWQVQGPSPSEGSASLEEGRLYEIRLEYFQWRGGAHLQLFWTPPGGIEQLIPPEVLYPAENTDQFEWPDLRVSRLDPGRRGYVFLDALYQGIRPRSLAVLKSASSATVASVVEAVETAQSNFTLSGKVTRLQLSGADLTPLDQKIRETTVHAASERLELAELPISDIPAGTAQIVLDRRYDGLRQGQSILVRGVRSAPPNDLAHELASIVEVEHDVMTGRTIPKLDRPLVYSYRRETVTLNANIARADHGESTAEVLGSGDAGQAFQSFALRQSPLTHTAAANATGSQSTLEIRVDGLRWHEVPSLYGRGKDERVYVTSAGEDDRIEIMFGDGRTGARLPTGEENVAAIYRRGIGRAGLIDAGQIRQFPRRPLGVRSVINPFPSVDAEDPEDPEQLRRNAPLTVLTLDRLVTLQDHADFARAFAGISKALATWSWDGQRRGISVTVAGTDGAPVQEQLVRDLLAAMRVYGQSSLPLTLLSYRPALFRLSATLAHQPDHQAEAVLSAVRKRLLANFSFEARSLAQPVAASEVLAVMHTVDGVVGIDLDFLYRSAPDGRFGRPRRLSRLLAAAPKQGAEARQLVGAELLRVDPEGIDLRAQP